MQNLESLQHLSPQRYEVISLVVVGSVYTIDTAHGAIPVVNCLNALTFAPYPHVQVIGVVPTSGSRGLLLRVEGDNNSLAFLAIDAPQTESYVPLWQGYATYAAGSAVEGLAPYTFLGGRNVQWFFEVVGGGSGTITIGHTTLTLPAGYTRTRIPLQPVPVATTALTPTVNFTGTTTLGGIFLVSQTQTVPVGG